jgi:nitrous oxide reductase accessory protein NosL
MRPGRKRSGLEKAFRLLVLSGVVLLWLGSLVRGAETKIPQATTRDKCPVCGMFIAKYPDWTSIILFNDGYRAFFDGPKDMFKYLFDLKKYNPARKAEDIAAIWVTDYYTLSPITAKTAWYVLGSDVFGPMGRELIPLEKEAEAKEFLKDHKGKRILRFSDISAEVIKTLD